MPANINVLLASLATRATLLFGQRRDVLTAPDDAPENRVRRARVAVVVIALALSIGLAWVNTSAAKYCWLLIQLAPWLADRCAARTTRPAGLRPKASHPPGRSDASRPWCHTRPCAAAPSAGSEKTEGFPR